MIEPIRGKFRISQDFGNKLMITDPKSPLYIAGKEDYYGRYKGADGKPLLGHNGNDKVPINDDGTLRSHAEVQAPFSGTIQESGFNADLGNYIKLEDNCHGRTLAHLSDILVEKDQYVEQGKIIGHTGNTGKSTGEHLHDGKYPVPRNRSNGYDGYIAFYPDEKPSPTVESGVGESAIPVKYEVIDEGMEMYPDKDGLNLKDLESMKVCVDVTLKYQRGLIVDKEKLDEAVNQLEQYKSYKAEAEHLAESVANLNAQVNTLKAGEEQSIKLATGALKVELEEKDKQIKDLTVKCNDLASKVAKPSLPSISTEEYNQLSNLVTQLRQDVKTAQDKYEICQTDYQTFRDKTEAERKVIQSQAVDVISSQEASIIRNQNSQLVKTNEGLLLELKQAQEGRVMAEEEVVKAKEALLLKDKEDFTAIANYIEKLEAEKTKGIKNFLRMLGEDIYSMFTRKSFKN